MIPDIALLISVIGYIILMIHPLLFEKFRNLNGQFFILKVTELGVIGYALASLVMLCCQKLFELFLKKFYAKEVLFKMLGDFNKAENGDQHSLFWSISTSGLPILLCWLWSSIALFLFKKDNAYWRKKVGSPITKLLLCYSLAKESSISRLILDSLIDQRPLLFFLKSRKSYVGLPTLVEINSGVAEAPFRGIAIFPILVAEEEEQLLTNSFKILQDPKFSIQEEQIFFSYSDIERISVFEDVGQ